MPAGVGVLRIPSLKVAPRTPRSTWLPPRSFVTSLQIACLPSHLYHSRFVRTPSTYALCLPLILSLSVSLNLIAYRGGTTLGLCASGALYPWWSPCFIAAIPIIARFFSSSNSQEGCEEEVGHFRGFYSISMLWRTLTTLTHHNSFILIVF